MQLLRLGLLLFWSAATHAQQLDYGHNPPVAPAVAEFAPDFPVLKDSEWDIPLGGFGGRKRGEAPGHVPVIFVHGNNVDACDWKLVRDDFREAGWSDQALWALSYNGLGNDVGNTTSRPDQRCRDEHAERNGGDSVSRITANDINVPDLLAFIHAVQDYTGSRRFSIVAHSLGVTLARQTLKLHPELRADLLAFVGIAGGNHGTTLCPLGSEFLLFGCNELTPGSDWLASLNGPDGEDETYPPAQWMTVYDGSGVADGAFLPPDQQSPQLKGADNREYPLTAHNNLRVDAAIVAEYREFLEAAETAGGETVMSQSGGGTLSLMFVAFFLLSRRFLLAGLALFSLPLMASEIPPPKPAPGSFASGFAVPQDQELGVPVGGFGGGDAETEPSHVPVIFLHGNTADACDWRLVREDFLEAGWNEQAIWALSYHGLGAEKGQAPVRPDPQCTEQRQLAGGDGIPRLTSNDVNVPDVAAFIRAVQDYTGWKKFSLVGHSLGVTLGRKTLREHPELAENLVAFVGIAGGNHGTSLCPPGTEKLFLACAEVMPGSAWLADLNGDDPEREFSEPGRWLMVYDGSGEGDKAYQGDTAQSPALAGAENREFPGVSHSDLRVKPEIVAEYRLFLEQASSDALAADKEPVFKPLLKKLIGR